MAVTDQQKLDFLLKKIGYTKTKTGSVVGTGAISGTPKQPFAEAIPSPLVVANSSLWNEADSIPATPPGADTAQVKVYLAATSGLRMTADATSSGQRAYIAYSTYNNTSSARLTNWIDTQFGASYIIKVYKGDPNSGGVNLSAAGSGANDGWFFDYSAGVLNFNDTSVPSGVTDTNIYIVGYRYVGQTGAPTSGISTFSYLDLTVERNLDVGVQGGISTFRNNIDLNADLDVDGHTNLDNVNITGISTIIDLDVDGHTNLDNVSVAGVSTFSSDIKLPDNVSIKFGTDLDGTIKHTGSNLQILETTGNIQITNYGNDRDVVISSDDGSGGTTPYFTADGSTGETLLYHYGNEKIKTTNTGINVTGNVVSDGLVVDGNSDLNGDLDVDGHTNLDNISVSGVSTFTGDATFAGNVSIGGTLTYEDVTNVDSVGLLTARSGIRVTGGVIEAQAGENKIPSLYANYSNLPNAGSYHGMFAHVHATGRGYFAHAGNWLELVNADTTGRVGTGTESYFIDRLVSTSTTATSLNVVGVSTFGGNLDINADIDVDGHTNLDNVSIAGFTTITQDLDVDGHTNLDNVSVAGVTTFSDNVRLIDGKKLQIGNSQDLQLHHTGGHSYIANSTGEISILNNNGTVHIRGVGNEAGIEVTNNETVKLYGASNTVRLVTSNTGVTVTGTVVADGADINGDIDVDGHTNLDNVSVAGVTTFSEDVKFTGASSNILFDKSQGDLEFDDNSEAVFGTGADLRIYHGNGYNYFRMGASNTEIHIKDNTNGNVAKFKPGGNNELYFNTVKKFETTSTGITVAGTVVSTGADINGDLDVDGHTELDNVNIVGVTTAAGHVLPSADVTYDLGSSSKQWRNLYADNIVSAPGNGFIGPDLTVRNFKATGISTFGGNARFNSTIAVHDGTTGSNGQYLKSVGTGVTWASFPTLRTRQTFTASAGQTSFTFTYTVNFIDVFVNGIKLTDSEFTATNGTSVVLAVGCFVGDIVELVSYNTISTGAGSGALNNIVEDTSPQLGGNLDLFNKTINGTGGINITGVVTATTFIGDGSGLTGITASGTGVVIKSNNSTVGTAGTINFGDDLSVTPIVAGIVTVGIDTSQINLDKLNVSGISTFNGNVDINADLDVDGHTNLDNLSVAGVTTFANSIHVADTIFHTGDTDTRISFPGNDHIRVEVGGNYAANVYTSDVRLHLDLTPNQDSNIDIGTSARRFANVYADTFVGNANVGVITATTLKGGLEATSGSFSSNIDANGDLDVDGHTNLDNVSIAGVTTFAGITTVTGNTLFTKQLNVSGVVTATTFVGALTGNVTGNADTATSVTNITVSANNSTNETVYPVFVDGATGSQGAETDTGLTYNPSTGNLSATAFTGDGSGLTNVSAAGISTTNLRADTLVVGENNNVAVSTFHNRVHIPTNDTIFFGDGLDASISWPTSGYLAISGGASGNMDINTGGNADVRIRAGGDFRVDTDHNEIAIRALHDGAVELYQNGYGSPTGLRFKTTGVGVTVIGITSMTDNLLVGAAATITPAGAAQFAGIVTANSFVGDGSGLTGITASGTGVVIKEGGSTVGTAGTINFVGVDVSPASAGIVTVSTATTSITDGNSKLFVNNVSSSNGNGSFEVFLNEFTYGGTRRALNMHQPSDGYGRIDLFHGAAPTTVEINAKTVYSGYARHRLKFETSNASYGGQLDFLSSTGTWNFYSTYQGTQKNLMNLNYNSINVQGTGFYPMTSNATDLGLSSYKWRQFHTTGVNAGVVTATTYHGDGSNLTGISGSQNLFQTIAVSGQSNVVADSTTDTLTLVAGSNMTITTNAGSDTITFASSGGSSTPAYTDVQVAYELLNSSSNGNGWRINGNGFANTTGNPDIYLVRGQKYRFINNSGGSHPFRIQSDASTAYNTGVTNNNSNSGNIDFIPQNSAPAKLYYNCTQHGGMLGVIYIIGEPGRGTTSAATGSIAQAAYADITIPTTGKTFALLKIAISAPAWVVLYTDTSSRTSDAAGTGSGRAEGTDPTPGSGVLAEVSTTTSGASTFKMTPGVIGWNDDGTPATQIYARVYNKRATSGSNAITVTLTTVNIEA